jgi:Fe2+ transport system protein FeoA
MSTGDSVLMSDTLISAIDVPIGQRVRVYQIGSGDHQIAFERLLEMGICPGRHLTVLYRPTNGAIMARTDGGHPIVIGSDLASGIMCVAAG